MDHTGGHLDEMLYRGCTAKTCCFFDEGGIANGQRIFQRANELYTLFLCKYSNSPYLFLSIDWVQHQGIVMLQEFLIAWPDGSIKADAEFPVLE